ncbi:hypothetical protein [Legionella yabuuchiae]|uniref:hypothetical protein n=1 Tax=Legionella yabuuchiae TaxID=376727 RepID=UPI0010547645|nr:hypothetical protein [Legionella yabuuchiae]
MSINRLSLVFTGVILTTGSLITFADAAKETPEYKLKTEGAKIELMGGGMPNGHHGGKETTTIDETGGEIGEDMGSIFP